MKMILIKPQIHMYEKTGDFLSEFHIGKDDLVLTHECIFESFIKKFSVDCDFIFPIKYGTADVSDTTVDHILKEVKGKEYKRIIAIGGGAIIDIAKFLVIKDLKNTEDIFIKKIPLVKNRELIAIPTTCGTGSELINMLDIELTDKKRKIRLAAEALYADHTVLIPELARSMQYSLFIYCTIDSLIYAIESYLSPKSNCYTELFSLKAVEMILKGYVKIIQNGENYRYEITEDFLIASSYAGIAFGNTGAGALHSLTHPVGENFKNAYGELNYQFLTEILKMYAGLKPDGKIKELGSYINSLLNTPLGTPFYKALENMLSKLVTKKKLGEYGLKEADIDFCIDGVMENQKRFPINNYVTLSKENIRNIYKKLL